MITVGCDPGTQNFAIVAINGRGRVFFARLLRCTIRSMSMHKAQQRPRHRRVMRAILTHLRPDELMIETFVARGFGTVMTELVNVMIGGIMNECDHLNIEEHATMASSWKNSVGQYYAWRGYERPGNRKALPRAATGHLYAHGAKYRVPMHLVDALLLATYLRHGKSMERVDWGMVRDNIVLISQLVPLDNLTREKRVVGRAKTTAKPGVSTRAGKKRRVAVRSS